MVRKYFGQTSNSGNILTGEFTKPVSSNVYANGNNQNGGNVLTSIPTIKVATIRSRDSFSVATMMGDETSSGVSSNVFATGSDQNSGNCLTDKPITRVRAPPGGVSTIRLM